MLQHRCPMRMVDTLETISMNSKHHTTRGMDMVGEVVTTMVGVLFDMDVCNPWVPDTFLSFFACYGVIMEDLHVKPT